jgi:hypothetical protein
MYAVANASRAIAAPAYFEVLPLHTQSKKNAVEPIRDLDAAAARRRVAAVVLEPALVECRLRTLHRDAGGEAGDGRRAVAEDETLERDRPTEADVRVDVPHQVASAPAVDHDRGPGRGADREPALRVGDGEAVRRRRVGAGGELDDAAVRDLVDGGLQIADVAGDVNDAAGRQRLRGAGGRRRKGRGGRRGSADRGAGGIG